MPLYEYYCGACKASFEALASLSASNLKTHPCPSCGGCSPRMLSPVHFASHARTQRLPQSHKFEGKPDVTNLTLPPAARLCWMDDQSAARLAAYKAGRGAEYDDRIAARKEVASQLGETTSASPNVPLHSHSPLSDPRVLANRRKAAQKEKVAESAAIQAGGMTNKA